MHEIMPLLNRWGLTPAQILPVGPVWRVRTETDEWCLKRGKHGLPRLLFDHHAIEFLWRSGYEGTPRLLPALSGEPYVLHGNDPYVVMKWVGRPLDETSLDEWRAAAAELARFHTYSAGMEIPSAVKKFYFSGKWVDRFAERTERLEAFLSAPPGRHAFEEEARPEVPLLLEEAHRASGLLQLSAYREMVDDLHARPYLSHGNIKGENFAVAVGGGVSLIDFDSFRCDVPVQDLSHLLSNALPALGWSFEAAVALYEAYSAERPLSHDERLVLLALLAYPYEASKVLHRYVDEPERPLAKTERKWQAALQLFRQNRALLQQWGPWLMARES